MDKLKQFQIHPDVKGWDANILDHHHPKFVYLGKTAVKVAPEEPAVKVAPKRD